MPQPTDKCQHKEHYYNGDGGKTKRNFLRFVIFSFTRAVNVSSSDRDSLCDCVICSKWKASQENSAIPSKNARQPFASIKCDILGAPSRA